MPDDVADDRGRAPENVEQHILEGDDLFDKPDRGIVDAFPQRLILFAELLLHRLHALVRRPVLLGQLVDELVGATIDIADHLFKIAADFLQRRCREFLFAAVQSVDEGFDLAKSIGDAEFGCRQFCFDKIGNLVDRPFDFLFVYAFCGGQRALDMLLPVITPSGQPSPRATFRFLECIIVYLFGASQPILENLRRCLLKSVERLVNFIEGLLFDFADSVGNRSLRPFIL